MADEPAPTITVQAVERAVDPTTGLHKVRVRFGIREADGAESEWSIWIDREEDFKRAEDLARKELHRISSAVAAAAAQTPDPSTPSGPDEDERVRRRREAPTNEGTGWA